MFRINFHMMIMCMIITSKKTIDLCETWLIVSCVARSKRFTILIFIFVSILYYMRIDSTKFNSNYNREWVVCKEIFELDQKFTVEKYLAVIKDSHFHLSWKSPIKISNAVQSVFTVLSFSSFFNLLIMQNSYLFLPWLMTFPDGNDDVVDVDDDELDGRRK